MPSACYWCGGRDAERVDVEESAEIGRVVRTCDVCVAPTPSARPRFLTTSLMRTPAVLALVKAGRAHNTSTAAMVARCIELSLDQVLAEAASGALTRRFAKPKKEPSNGQRR